MAYSPRSVAVAVVGAVVIAGGLFLLTGHTFVGKNSGVIDSCSPPLSKLIAHEKGTVTHLAASAQYLAWDRVDSETHRTSVVVYDIREQTLRTLAQDSRILGSQVTPQRSLVGDQLAYHSGEGAILILNLTTNASRQFPDAARTDEDFDGSSVLLQNETSAYVRRLVDDHVTSTPGGEDGMLAGDLVIYKTQAGGLNHTSTLHEFNLTSGSSVEVFRTPQLIWPLSASANGVVFADTSASSGPVHLLNLKTLQTSNISEPLPGGVGAEPTISGQWILMANSFGAHSFSWFAYSTSTREMLSLGTPGFYMGAGEGVAVFATARPAQLPSVDLGASDIRFVCLPLT